MRFQRCLAMSSLVSVSFFGVACASGSEEATESVVSELTAPATTKGTVVVTYSALGSLVADLVGGVADVQILVPNGLDPHDFEPSARDVEKLTKASLVVANGLDLEEGLEDALGEVAKSGTPVFYVTDHVTLRTASVKEDDHGAEGDAGHGEGAEGDAGHGHGDEDPHIWLDPLTLAEAIPALAAEIGDRIGVDLSDNVESVVTDLVSLNDAIAAEIGTLESCVLLTGHDSLGYFGARYGCEIVGSIVPGFSTAAEATAGELAKLKKVAESRGVKAIFTEQGTPKGVAERIAAELKVDVIELPHHRVPDGGGYAEMMENLARTIVDGLA